jgi:hypothetical protein
MKVYFLKNIILVIDIRKILVLAMNVFTQLLEILIVDSVIIGINKNSINNNLIIQQNKN